MTSPSDLRSGLVVGTAILLRRVGMHSVDPYGIPGPRWHIMLFDGSAVWMSEVAVESTLDRVSRGL